MSIKQAASIIKKKLTIFEHLKELCSDHPGYIGKFTEYLFSNDIDIEDFKSLYTRIRNLNDKSIKIDIYKHGYEKLIDLIQIVEDDLFINKVISILPSVLKTDYKSLSKSTIKTYYPILLELSKHPHLSTFTDKISKYKTIYEMCNSAILFLKDSVHDLDKVLAVINNLTNTHIVYQDGHQLIVQVDSQNDIIELAHDTSWCIVTSKSNYKYYTNNRIQFVWYDFSLDSYDPSSKIGITVERDGVVHSAYNKINTYWHNEVSKLLNKCNINLFNLIYRPSIKQIPLSKLNDKTAYTKYEQFATGCDVSDIKKFVIKLLSFGRLDHRRITSIIALALTRYYTGDVLDTDIDTELGINLSYKLIGHNGFGRNIHSTKLHFLDKIHPDMIVKYLDKFNYDAIEVGSFVSAVSGYGSINPNTIELLRNHMLSIRHSMEFSSIQSKEKFESALIIINYIVDDATEIEDNYKIWDNMLYSDKIEYCHFFPNYKITLMPSEDDLIIVNVRPEYINLQDYDNIYLSRSNYRRVFELVESSPNYQIGIVVPNSFIPSHIRSWQLCKKYTNMLLDFVDAPTEITSIIYGNITLKRNLIYTK